jgi:hypothetical protein
VPLSRLIQDAGRIEERALAAIAEGNARQASYPRAGITPDQEDVPLAPGALECEAERSAACPTPASAGCSGDELGSHYCALSEDRYDTEDVYIAEGPVDEVETAQRAEVARRAWERAQPQIFNRQGFLTDLIL